MRPVTNWAALPEEMRERPQWAVAGASKAPMAWNGSKLVLVSVREPSTWMTFEDACAIAERFKDLVTTDIKNGVTVTQTGLTVGYIINAADPFACIDLDVKDAATHPDDPSVWSTADDFARYLSIVHAYDSFTERSKSGKGLHVWVKGAIGKGFRRDGVEVYSQERFIICTGDVYVNKPIENREHILNNMVSRMRPVENTEQLVELEQEADDWYILQVAISAANSDKFSLLWQGKWREFDFKSQSEADLALMSMFTFYSDSNAQCRRLFRESGLGKREKAVKNDKYLNFTLITIRTRQARERSVELNGILQAADNIIAIAREEIQRLQGGVPAAQAVDGPFGLQAPRVVVPLQVPGTGEPVAAPAPAEAQLAQLAPVTPQMVAAGEQGLAWPPGFVGALSRFIYGASWLPIKEVSIVAALGLMAGICGKAWHIPKSGLNLYIVLVARSAIGKEAMHDGVACVVNACIQKMGSFGNFVDFTEYASGPALIKACSQNTSFVNVSGEWGRRMKRIAMEDDREGPMSTLRTQMTNLYQKSAPKSIVGGIGYSSTENNIEALQSVAYSMIGESTPQTFYDSLTETMMEDGFLSRFLVVAYDGDRPEENANIVDVPDEALCNHMCTIANQAERNIGNTESQAVERTEEAAHLLSAFSIEAAKQIRSTNDEARRQMWNRATLKVLRLAALIAVGDNFTTPIVTKEHAEWAIDLIMRDIRIMKDRLDSGDVGLNDASRERKLVQLMKDYLTKPIPPSYKVPEGMKDAGIVPRSFLQTRTSRVSAFYKHKFGPNKSLDDSIQQLISSGYIMEVKGDKLVEAFSHHGKGYRILKLPDYDAMSRDRE